MRVKQSIILDYPYSKSFVKPEMWRLRSRCRDWDVAAVLETRLELAEEWVLTQLL